MATVWLVEVLLAEVWLAEVWLAEDSFWRLIKQNLGTALGDWSGFGLGVWFSGFGIRSHGSAREFDSLESHFEGFWVGRDLEGGLPVDQILFH